jgi:cystathionine beta-lyase/cystathionine gamma-synthase
MTVERPGFETKAIHAGQEPDPVTGAVVPPISLATTFAQPAVGEHTGFEYARTGNPTRRALEVCLAALEGATHGFAFASGMAAEDAVLRTLAPGDHVIIPTDAYGGTYRLLSKVFEPAGITWTAADLTDKDALEAAWRDETRVVWVESPTNPALTVVDIAAVAQVAHARNGRVVVDNTFATPYLQQPLALGADVVVHSTTKYLNGHSDMVGGALIVRRDDLGERLRFLQNAVGAVPGPWDCWLALRGTKTLALRMDRHQLNAAQIAQFLAGEKKVQRLFYPGLPNHPGHALAKRQMSGFGAIVTLEVGGLAEGKRFAEALRLFTLAESLGGVESLVSHPASMTHASVPREQREATGFTDGLVRLSVGCEDAPDLIADLSRALSAV